MSRRSGVIAIDNVTASVSRLAKSRPMTPSNTPDREQDEGELAALAQHQPEPPRGAVADPPPAAESVEDHRLDDHEPGDDRRQRRRTRHEHGKIHGHADGDEEHRKQEPFERRDIRLDLMAIFGVGEQRAGDERPERRRQSHRLHDQRHAHHREQRARGHRLAHARGGNEAVEPAQQEAADDNHPDDGEDGNAGALEIHARLVAAEREQRHQRNQGNGGEVLEQEHREGEAPVTRGELALLLQHLEREGGRRQRQRQTDEQRLPGRKAEHHANRREHEGGGDELRRTEAENSRAQGPQSYRTELEPDHEQEQHDAELAELENLLDIVEGVEGAQHVGSDDHTGGEITQHGADAEKPAEWGSNSGGGQKHRHLNELRRGHGRLYPQPLGYHAIRQAASGPNLARPVRSYIH